MSQGLVRNAQAAVPKRKELYRELTAYQYTLEEQNLPEYVFRRKLKERKAEIDAELEPLRCKDQLPGTITQDSTIVQVELCPFNDRALNRDLAVLCERVNQASPCLPDGRRLSFTIRPSCCILAAQKKAKYRESLIF